MAVTIGFLIHDVPVARQHVIARRIGCSEREQAKPVTPGQLRPCRGDRADDRKAEIGEWRQLQDGIAQIQAAIEELQKKGYDIPKYPEEAKTEADKALQAGDLAGYQKANDEAKALIRAALAANR